MTELDLPNWQTVLQKIISQPKERQRLAAALGVNAITLTRWAKANSHPQKSHLARLVTVVQPRERSELLTALSRAYPDMYDKIQEESTEAIPTSFFRQILRDRAAMIDTLRPWHLSSAIIDKSIELLDLHKLGMAVTPALCMPPMDGRISSLREQGGRATPPWTADLEQKSLFLGMNSLAGYVVQNGHAASVRDTRKELYIPVFAFPENLEISAAACPIWLEGKIAGCLLAASTQPEHFTQSRIDMLQQFANIFSLALNPNNFYEHQSVQLRFIPEPNEQAPILQVFRRRVSQIMAEAGRNNEQLSNAEAELRTWQEIEGLLLIAGQKESQNP